MFAISDGSIKMYYDLYTPGENISASDYLFDQSKYKNEYFAFTNGVIYVLPKHSFVQGKDNEGRLINEWLSTEPVTPLGSIIASPSDFPFFPQKK